jgi:hypothetical protein
MRRRWAGASTQNLGRRRSHLCQVRSEDGHPLLHARSRRDRFHPASHSTKGIDPRAGPLDHEGSPRPQELLERLTRLLLALPAPPESVHHHHRASSRQPLRNLRSTITVTSHSRRASSPRLERDFPSGSNLRSRPLPGGESASPASSMPRRYFAGRKRFPTPEVIVAVQSTGVVSGMPARSRLARLSPSRLRSANDLRPSGHSGYNPPRQTALPGRK